MALIRKTVQDITLSDGTFLPKNTLLVTPELPTLQDPENFVDPLMFNPWRSYEMREREGDGSKFQIVNTSPKYLVFGHGKHAW